MNELGKNDYVNARYEAGKLASSSLGQLAATIDYLNKQTIGEGFSLAEFLAIYRDRLNNNADTPSRSTYHGAAYIFHNLELHERVASIFGNLATSIEERTNCDRSWLDVIKRARTTIANMHKGVGAFTNEYADDIAAEKQSDGYQLDIAVIETTVRELAQVTKLGQWTPEYIAVTDRITGSTRTVELPSSEKMGRLAGMVPQLHKLGWGLGGF